MWSILENVPSALEKNVYFVFWGFFFGGESDVLKISSKSNFFIVSFRISLAFLIFFLEDMSIDVSGVLKSPHMRDLFLASGIQGRMQK